MLDYKQKIEDDEVADINNNVSTTINQKEQEEDSQKEGVRVVQIVTPENLPTETSSVSSCQVGTDKLPPPMPPNSISTNSAFSIKTTNNTRASHQKSVHEPSIRSNTPSPPPIADTDCCMACTIDSSTTTVACLQSPTPKRPSQAYIRPTLHSVSTNTTSTTCTFVAASAQPLCLPSTNSSQPNSRKRSIALLSEEVEDIPTDDDCSNVAKALRVLQNELLKRGETAKESFVKY